MPRRPWQIPERDAIYVIGQIQEDNTVRGGTGWGAEFAKLCNKSLFVFDQEKDGWFTWEQDQWQEDAAPRIQHPLYGWGRPGEENRPSLDTSMEEQAVVRVGDILLRDPYHEGNDTFHERRESAWATMKIDALKDAFGYPDEYQVDRDIVHPIAFDRARENGQSLEPQSVEGLIHDLVDAFGRRFSRAIQMSGSRCSPV